MSYRRGSARCRRFTCVAAITGLAALALAPAPAHAYVHMRTPDGVALAWRGACPILTITTDGADGVEPSGLVAALEAGREAWRGGGPGCAPPPIEVVDGRAGGPGLVAYDGDNAVVVRDAAYCADPDHGDDEVCLSPNAAAVTTVFFHDRGDRAGEIVEIDIEVNAAFEFAVDGAAGRVDLISTVTHELGHALGLEHTCETIPGRAPLIDSAGHTVPPCFPLDGVSADARAATMFPFLEPGDVGPRTPLADEVAAMCDLYAGRPGTCEAAGPGCGCRGSPAPSALTAAAVAAMMWRRRRRRRPRCPH